MALLEAGKQVVLVFLVMAVGLQTSFSLEENQQEVVVELGQGIYSPSGCSFPENLKLEMKSQTPFRGSTMLKRKDEIDTDAPAYVIKTEQNGVVVFERLEKQPKAKSTAAYQSSEYGAAFLVRCSSGSLYIEGSIYLDGKKYRVTPALERSSRLRGHTLSDVYLFNLVTDMPHNDQELNKKMRERHKLDMSSQLTLSTQKKPANSTRGKREAKDYYIDVLVALDYNFFKYWKNRVGGNRDKAINSAKEYIAYIFNGINSRFDTITTLTSKLHVRLSGFLIAETASAAPWTEKIKEASPPGLVDQVNANKVLVELENYFKTNWNNLPVPDSDHVMLFTGYDLYGEDSGFRFNNTAGFAIIGTMCYADGRSVSVVEDRGGFQSETTATHELGHSLGAKHDGDNNSCDSADRFVMASGVHPETEANKRNPWHFSNCSVNYFQNQFQQMINSGFEKSCLLKKSNASDVPSVVGLPGQLAGPDEQCRQIYGATSYLCRGTSFGRPEDVCVSMYCRNPNTTSTCTLNTAAPGTCCGNGKWCLNGQCVESNSAQCYMSETCPFGQRQGAVYENLTCNDMPSANCYTANFGSVCCEMCDKSRRNVTGCEFGDKVLSCNATYCGRTYNNGDLYDTQCCGTCNHIPRTTTTITPPSNTVTTTTTGGPEQPLVVCQDVAIVNGTTCGAFLDHNGLLYCCMEDVQRYCCHTCQHRKSADPSCPYGDCDPKCSNLQGRITRCDNSQRELCCRTCQQVDERTTTKATRSSATTSRATTSRATTSRATTRDSSNSTNRNTNSNTSNGGGATDKPKDDCVPILGVRTCGAVRLTDSTVWLVVFAFGTKVFL